MTEVRALGRTDLGGPRSLVDALTASGGRHLRAGDCLVVSSKVVSKALGLTWTGTREDAVAAGTVRVVAERHADAGASPGSSSRSPAR